MAGSLITIGAEVPDEIPPVGSGIRTLTVSFPPKVVPVKRNGVEVPGSSQLQVAFKVDEPDNLDHNRPVYDTFDLSNLQDKVRLKQCNRALGVKMDPKDNSFSPEEMQGRTCKAVVTPNSWTDKTTGKLRTNSKISEYQVPA